MNQSCDFQAFDDKKCRRNLYKNKKKNKQNAIKRKALARKEVERVEVETNDHIPNPNNVPGRLNCQAGLIKGINWIDLLPVIPGLDTSRIVSELENITALYITLSEAQSTRQAAGILFLYLKTHCSGSVLTSAFEFLRMECDFDVLDNQDSEGPEWLSLLRSCRTNWTAITNNKAFKKISLLLSMCASLGLCDLASLKFDVNGIRIFSIPALRKHINASDLMDALFDTFSYFIEGGYKCFQQGSLTPFIFSSDEAVQFENEYFDILDLAPFMKAGNLLTKKNVTENDFDLKLNKAIDKADALYRASEGTWEKKVLFDRLTQLRKIRADFISVRVDGKLRQAPFAIYIEGASGVGKSSVSALLMRVVLMANGFDASDERLITLNEADKYMSTYRSHINGIFIDDLGNTREAFVEKSPVEKVIEIVNNVPAYANMAEADLKGKVSIEPHCVIGTSNIDLKVLAKKYSNEAYSIVRRFPLHCIVRVKKEFAMEDGRLDSNLVHKKYPEGIPAVPDLWEIDVYEPFDDSMNGFRKFIGTESISRVIERACRMSTTHFRNQTDVVEFASNLDQRLEFCSDCKRPGSMCSCALEEQALTQKLQEIRTTIAAIRSYDGPWLKWTNYVPEWFFDSPKFDAFLTFLQRRNLWNTTTEGRRAWIGSLVAGCLTLAWSFFISLAFMGFTTFLYVRNLVKRKNELVSQLRDMNGAMPLVFRRIRDNHIQHIAAAGTLLGVLYVAVRAYRASKVLSHQGNLAPTSLEEVQERDSEVNPWAGLVVTPPPKYQDHASGIQRDALKQRVFENLFFLEIESANSKKFCNAFFIKSNVAVIPSHILPEGEAVGCFYRRGDLTNGAYFRANLSREFAVQLPNTDLLMVWVASAPSARDLTKYVCVDDQRRVPAAMVWKSRQGEMKEFKAMLVPGLVRTAVASFQGFNYKLAEDTFNGLCMGVWISDSVTRQIVGFHLGGKGKLGGAGKITASMLTNAETLLRKKEGVLLAKSKGQVMTNQYGVEFYEGPHVHEKSPTRFLPVGNNIEVLGSVAGRATMFSNVVPTNISPIVEEVCGVPQQWGKPQFGPQRWKPWQASLEQSSTPSVGMEGNLLKKAVVDYKKPLIDLLRKSDFFKQDIKPLTNMETVCGIDGKRFIDKMKPSTSVGYPLSGPKADYLTELDPEQYDDFNYPVELDQMFWDEFDKMESIWLKGERAYPVFKAALKDEPTKLDKEKVRVFQAAPLALQLAVRKYFLPIARFLSLNSLVSECAVGINAQGPEWDQLARHVKKYGADRILAGDYSKYDLRMSSQLMSAAFRILIDLARETGNYTERDISIMEGIATEISHPLMAYNGDLIQHFGSNPSGQNLTVYINSIVNSLLFRCAFYSICAERKLTCFQDVVSLITYGDDAKSSVREGWDEFNHIAVAEFLAARDMKFTMPDKTSIPTKFMTDEAADLLKRKNVFNKEVGLYFGALDESSIFKSLHSVLRSKAVTNDEQCMSNIDGACREWFAHGRDVYEKRRLQMQEVAEKSGLAFGCQELDVSYDEALDRFCEKYGVEKLDAQSGEIPTESSQTRELQEIFRVPVVATNWELSFGTAPLGEVDVVMETLHAGRRVIVLVELKAHYSTKRHAAARQQIIRYAKVMSILQPHASVYAYTYCGNTLKLEKVHNKTSLRLFR